MNVLYISRACTPAAGGMERLSYEFLQHLQQSPDITVQAITRHTTGRAGALFFTINCLPAAFRAVRTADVIHLGDPVLSFTGWLLQKATGKPVIVTVHGLDVSYPHPLYRLYLRLFFRHFKLYLPISQHAQQLLELIKPCGTTTVLLPGLDDRHYNPHLTRQDWASHFELKPLLKYESNIILATVGRLVKRKGHAWFIEHVLPRLPHNVTYVIAGQGPEFYSIQNAIRVSNQSDRVILLQRISDPAAQTLYNTLDAFIQPNISIAGDAEGFGLVLLEAALCNKTIFAANLEGIRSAISHQENGYLLEPADATAWIQQLTTYSKQPAAVALKPRDFTKQRFSWPHFMQQYDKLLRTIVSSQ